MKKLLKPALAVALATMSTGAVAQTYSSGSGVTEQVIYQILQNVIGNRYQTDNRYQSREYQEAFRRADTNRDGVLSQWEIDAYRARYGNNSGYGYGYGNDRYDDRYDNAYRYDRRGLRVRDIDINRDGWVSTAEQQRFLQLIQSQRRGY